MVIWNVYKLRIIVLFVITFLHIITLLYINGNLFKKEASKGKFVRVEREAKIVTRRPFTFRRSKSSYVVLSADSPSANLTTLIDEVTIVTAYFDLGSFDKGSSDVFGPGLYRRWMTVFSRIVNPVVFYYDTDNDATYFDIVRSRLLRNQTRTVKVGQNDLWAFSLVPHIKQIFNQPWYPKHPPNTIRADYSAAMHAKYELVQRTIRENPFRTRYVCWLDVGLFRDLVPAIAQPSLPGGAPFQLALPDGFDAGKVAYSEVASREPELDAERIVVENRVWVCGCFFIGRVDVMFRWTAEYMEGVERMLESRWMSTDQQVIYWLYNKNLHRTEIMTYSSQGGSSHTWFYLAYLSKGAGEKRGLANFTYNPDSSLDD